MASAVLASRNESNWGQSGAVFMGKQLPSSYSNHHHLNPNPNPNPNNPNSVPKKKKKKQFHHHSLVANGHHHSNNGVVSPPAVTQAASDDAYSFNQRPIDAKSGAAIDRGDDAYVSFDIGSCTRHELVELKKRLVAELEQIQRLNERIESGDFKRHPRDPPQLLQHGKSNRKLSGNKRQGPTREQLPVVSPRERVPDGIELAEIMKMCRQVLTKLMMHKSSWIFKTPVDAVALGLHDYHQIVKRPMDLGTVKSNFSKNLYSFPGDFATDVRLIFENAILYNPKGDEVHRIAEQLLDRFEELYRPIQDRLKGNDDRDEREEVVQGSSWNHNHPAPENPKKKKPKSMPTPKEKIEVVPAMPSSPSNPSSPNPPLVQSPEAAAKAGGVRGSYVGKQPKPKARDPNKRPMSMEEKHKLGLGLQSLPEEKMPQLVQIIRKRNKHMAPEGDEIELDIEAIDTETLWELDRFVTNWKKMDSKNKRQALMTNNAVATTASGDDNVEVHVSEKTDAVKKPKKGEAGEEDVDIGDEMPMTHFPPVEIEKDDGAVAGGGGHDNKGHATSSSSSSSGSSSDSSSSSDSESGSSSGSDSDADDAESRGRESKEFSKT